MALVKKIWNCFGIINLLSQTPLSYHVYSFLLWANNFGTEWFIFAMQHLLHWWKRCIFAVRYWIIDSYQKEHINFYIIIEWKPDSCGSLDELIQLDNDFNSRSNIITLGWLNLIVMKVREEARTFSHLRESLIICELQIERTACPAESSSIGISGI